MKNIQNILIGALIIIVAVQHLAIGEVRRRLAKVETMSSLLMAGYQTDHNTQEP